METEEQRLSRELEKDKKTEEENNILLAERKAEEDRKREAKEIGKRVIMSVFYDMTGREMMEDEYIEYKKIYDNLDKNETYNIKDFIKSLGITIKHPSVEDIQEEREKARQIGLKKWAAWEKRKLENKKNE